MRGEVRYPESFRALCLCRYSVTCGDFRACFGFRLFALVAFPEDVRNNFSFCGVRFRGSVGQSGGVERGPGIDVVPEGVFL